MAKSGALLLVCCALLGTSCTSTVSPGGNIAVVSVQPDVALPASHELIQRNDAYREVFEQARLHGFVAGAIRGALLGALIDSEAGIFIGAAFGAAFGSAYANTTAERLLQERDEFLNRQQVIENILAASGDAASRTAEDAEIVSRAVTEWSNPVVTPHTEGLEQTIDSSISTLRRAAEMRAVLIEELFLSADLTEQERVHVRTALDRQWASVRQIRAEQELWRAMRSE